MAGSTESTKGLIFVNQSDTQPQRGGFRHSNKKSQQHWRLSPVSSQISLPSTITIAAHCLQAFIFIAAWTQSCPRHEGCDVIRLQPICFEHATISSRPSTPGTKCVISKNVCAKWFHFLILNLKVSPSVAVTTATRHFLLFPSCFFLFFRCSLPFYFLIVFFLSFIPSCLASSAFPFCFLYSVPSFLPSFLPPFSPSFPSSSPFRISLPSSCLPFFLGLFLLFLRSLPPSYLIAHHLCPHPCFLPSIFPSILPTSSVSSYFVSFFISFL